MELTHVDLLVEPDNINDAAHIRAQALLKAGLDDDGGVRVRVVRRSVDARAKMPRFLSRIAIGGTDTAPSVFAPRPLGGERVIVVGAGPGGYFAALTLLEAGIKPVLLERGRDVRARLKDVKKI